MLHVKKRESERGGRGRVKGSNKEKETKRKKTQIKYFKKQKQIFGMIKDLRNRITGERAQTLG